MEKKLVCDDGNKTLHESKLKRVQSGMSFNKNPNLTLNKLKSYNQLNGRETQNSFRGEEGSNKMKENKSDKKSILSGIKILSKDNKIKKVEDLIKEAEYEKLKLNYSKPIILISGLPQIKKKIGEESNTSRRELINYDNFNSKNLISSILNNDNYRINNKRLSQTNKIDENKNNDKEVQNININTNITDKIDMKQPLNSRKVENEIHNNIPYMAVSHKNNINSDKIIKQDSVINDSLPKCLKIISKAINNNEISQVCTNLFGLDNLGNTCYMNTGLQIILHTDKFIEELFKLGIENQNEVSNKIRAIPISKGFYDLCREINAKIDSNNYKSYSIRNTSSISPRDLKKVFGNIHKSFSGYNQHDTQEFIRLFLEDISKEFNRVVEIPKYKELDTSSLNKRKLNKDYDKLFKAREDSIVIDIFYGQIVNTFKCLDCNLETFSFEKFFDIPLLLERECSVGFNVEDLLDDFFKFDKFKWDTPCENKICQKKSYHLKLSKIAQLPEILTVSIQRYNNRYRKKNSSKMKYNEVLDLTKYIDVDCICLEETKEDFSGKYKLYGISNHTGSLDYGHYFA